MYNKNWKIFAPECSHPNCTEKVSYHKKAPRTNSSGTYIKWKVACELHRTKWKSQFDAWKIANGCENRDGRHGFKCPAPNVSIPAQIDIHHPNGRSDPNCVERLCKNCHAKVTMQNEDYKNRYPDTNITPLDPAIFETEE